MSADKSSFPYAKAIFELAQKNDHLEKFKEELLSIKELLNSNIEFKDLIQNPVFKKEQKSAILKSLFEGKISESLVSFLTVLVHKGRISQLNDIIDVFIDLYNKSKNNVIVKIITSQPISSEFQSKIAKQVTDSEQLTIENTIDPEIIGGFIVECGNKILDHSIASKIKKFKTKFNS